MLNMTDILAARDRNRPVGEYRTIDVQTNRELIALLRSTKFFIGKWSSTTRAYVAATAVLPDGKYQYTDVVWNNTVSSLRLAYRAWVLKECDARAAVLTMQQRTFMTTGLSPSLYSVLYKDLGDVF